MIVEAMFIGGAINAISKMVEADKMELRAEKVNIRSFERSAEAEEKYKKQKLKTETSLLKLINRKRGIYQTSISSFLYLYKDLQKINFEEGEGIKELSASVITPVAVEEMKERAGVSRNELSESQMVATYLFGGITGLIKKDAEMNLSAANIRRHQAKMIEEQAESLCIVLDAVSQRAERMSDVLKNLNALFMKTLRHTQQILNKNGLDKNKYTLNDREAIRVCFNFAKGIKDILDVPLLDKQGEVTKKSLEVIQMGEEFFDDINKTIRF